MILAANSFEVDGLTFSEPLWFAALAVVPLLLGLKLFTMARGSSKARSFVAPRLAGRLVLRPRQGLGWITFCLEIAGIVLLVTALARPQKGYTEREIKVEGRNLLLALDVSRSMLAVDDFGEAGSSLAGKPTRLELAKLAAKDLVRALPGERVGLIAFAGNAFQQVPLTVDHSAVRESLEQININAIERGGTNLAAAINKAVESFAKTDANQKALVIFTDGDDLEGDSVGAAAKAREEGITIFTIGLGSPEGSIIQYKTSRGSTVIVKDRQQNVVRTKLDAETLNKIAETTGGAFVNLRDGRVTDRLARSLVDKLDFTSGDSRSKRIPNELFQWPLGFAFLFLLAGYLAGPVARAVRRPDGIEGQLLSTGTGAAAGMVLLLAVMSPDSLQAVTYEEAQYSSGPRITARPSSPSRNSSLQSRKRAEAVGRDFTSLSRSKRKRPRRSTSGAGHRSTVWAISMGPWKIFRGRC